ncbi:endonuclease/exonuclease/phosphatase family protein [Rubrobacter indicoceani]|uniref:endonuclease/exonuclease/phosphatase family protein n=1 Tax=Rubrobacter indicoceani TaxID=2051957 RepID=UPI000E5B2844|nr:endonuclease/exonuclease/phosphatase family protein [Rubrobacter indicoceani]
MRRLVDDVRQLVREARRGRTGIAGESRRDAVPEREPEELRVMTFNIRGALHPDGKNAWNRRAALNVDVIRCWKPDLIGFQEFQRGNLKTYKEHLPEYEKALGPRYQNGRPHAFNAVFWSASRMELLDASGFWLSETPDEFSGSWETRQIRSANLLRFRLPENREFVFLNTHLDHRSIPARQNGSKLITEKLEPHRDTPAIITGDFNAEPGKPAHGIFSEAGFKDTHLLCGNPPTKTFHRFEGESFGREAKRELRMDWILVRDGPDARWTAIASHIVRDCDPPVFPSDHYPVTTRLQLVRKP